MRKSKCKNTKINLKGNDYFQWIKTFYNKQENRVCRIEIYSHQKQKYELGQRKEELMSDT